MRKKMRKMMHKIAFMCKMMRKMKISSSEDNIEMSSSGIKYLLPVELKDFLLELGLSGFGETTPNANLGSFPASTNEHTFSY